MSEKWDALRIAEWFEGGYGGCEMEAAAELRRLHAENKRLETLCYDYLGELTAMRAVEHMRKQRKPLTDEEIAAISADCAASAYRWDDFEFARAIERAHGIGEKT